MEKASTCMRSSLYISDDGPTHIASAPPPTARWRSVCGRSCVSCGCEVRVVHLFSMLARWEDDNVHTLLVRFYGRVAC